MQAELQWMTGVTGSGTQATVILVQGMVDKDRN